jgi:hypothetical protein
MQVKSDDEFVEVATDKYVPMQSNSWVIRLVSKTDDNTFRDVGLTSDQYDVIKDKSHYLASLDGYFDSCSDNIVIRVTVENILLANQLILMIINSSVKKSTGGMGGWNKELAELSAQWQVEDFIEGCEEIVLSITYAYFSHSGYAKTGSAILEAVLPNRDVVIVKDSPIGVVNGEYIRCTVSKYINVKDEHISLRTYFTGWELDFPSNYYRSVHFSCFLTALIFLTVARFTRISKPISKSLNYHRKNFKACCVKS